jgi:hypothetical protein
LIGEAEDAIVQHRGALGLFGVGGLVLSRLFGQIEGIADPWWCHLPHRKNLHSQWLQDGSESLQTLHCCTRAAIPKKAALHHQVPFHSRHHEVPIKQVLALAVLQGQIVVIPNQPLVATLADINARGACRDGHHEIVAMPGVGKENSALDRCLD